MYKQLIMPAVAAVLACLAQSTARADYSNSIIALNPVAYWPLNETAQPPSPVTAPASNLGTLGADFNGAFTGDVLFGYPGALAGTTDTADGFAGATQTLTPFSPAISTGPSFTVEAWLLSHDTGAILGTSCPLSDFNANSPRSGWLIYLDINNVGQYTFRTYNQNGTTPSLSLDIGAAGSIKSEQWNHLAIVVSNAVTVTNVYGYLNGTLVAGPVALPAYVPNDGAAGGFSIGSRTDGGFHFVGALDEVAYYTNALDGATVLAHFQAGTNPAPTTAYATLVQQSHPALYYRLDEVATPLAGPYLVPLPVAANHGSFGAAANGYYQPGTFPGIAGPTNSGFGPASFACGFSTNGVQSSSQSGPGVLCAPYHQALLNFTQAMTMTAWIRVPAATVDWFQTPLGRGDHSYRMDVDGTGFPHFAAAPNSDVVGATALNDGLWHLWAGVFEPASASSLLYIDGVPVGSLPGSPLTELTYYFLIGGAPDYNGRNFVGDICHVALFTNALSSAQIGTLYGSVGVGPTIFLPTNAITLNEGANGGITATVAGTTPLSFQWFFQDLTGTTNLALGQTSATLSLTNVQIAQNGFSYFLVASNTYGAVTSSVVALTVVQGPPQIQVDVQPLSQQVPVGVQVTYSVLVSGTVPFHYQWFQDGSAVSGATNSAYTFAALSGTHHYDAVITNAFGNVTSATATLIGSTTPPPVVTFNTDGTGWTINTNNTPNAAITNGTFLVTDGITGQAASAFFNTPQYDGGFAAFFTYLEADGDTPLADGATFCIQNSAQGAAALGGGGGELGFTGISNSAAFEINIYAGANGGRGIQFGTNGMTADSASPTGPYLPTAPVNLASAHPINVSLYFSQGIFHLRLVDATTGDSFVTTHALGGSMRDVIGADSAYVGFTGATGGQDAIQTISAFRFSYTTPPVLSVAKTGANVVVSWPVSVATLFQLQQSSSVTGPWSNVGTPPTVVGLQNQVSLPSTGGAQFFRLTLQ